MNRIWHRLSCNPKELNLGLVLSCGQSFRWKQSTQDPNTWVGVLNRKLWLLKQLDQGDIEYQTLVDTTEQKKSVKPTDPAKDRKIEEKTKSVKLAGLEREDNETSEQKKSIDLTDPDKDFLTDYFQMNVKVEELYQKWSETDLFFQELETPFYGIRILRQDPVENLFSFICSQNNNISRISQLVEKLAEHYGDHIATFEGTKYYSFPTMEALSKTGVEENLRKLGFGYRAKFIQKVAETVCGKENSVDWLFELRAKPYKEAHSALCTLYGVGPKVADCVCLMSLDKHDAIPVDTHMWQVAANQYLPHLKKNKNITDKAYKEIGDFFRQQFGEYAGWAQSVLFSSDLKKFESLKEEGKKKIAKRRHYEASDGVKKTKSTKGAGKKKPAKKKKK
ncbi:N-glycosylase/DNA lyase-like [Clytia hemisphaerica]|uniref:N-glycosylase/DNA lyase n=1 Tax=Clytia hemisphaerica TaxID=252671 RepID=A0A7M5WSL0_9CNID